ncbi:hypothetical protein MtrunA17_Chr7g0235881 [Medicago truncatula]|uniref:Transmembrane protein n=1 Tax=Medicago truncatula TaxID=3880 RepID=A0A396H2A5_MEDTR|nr:hypothetical protein MtrunA17_Chr7g0235881 [Medicago truncatula]
MEKKTMFSFALICIVVAAVRGHSPLATLSTSPATTLASLPATPPSNPTSPAPVASPISFPSTSPPTSPTTSPSNVVAPASALVNTPLVPVPISCPSTPVLARSPPSMAHVAAPTTMAVPGGAWEDVGDESTTLKYASIMIMSALCSIITLGIWEHQLARTIVIKCTMLTTDEAHYQVKKGKAKRG